MHASCALYRHFDPTLGRFSLITLGGVIALRLLPQELRPRPAAAVGRWMAKHMEQIMVSLPANAPPKLVMTVLPKLQAQNERIIALLQEQNELLRRNSSVPLLDERQVRAIDCSHAPFQAKRAPPKRLKISLLR